MSTISTKETKTNIGRDIWFCGASNLNGPNGKPCYYMCDQVDKLHHFTETNTYGQFCKFRQKPMSEVTCDENCEKFGYCDTCAGFSAIRCQECDIIR